jgi:murein DD-endopeptidase MepM/ murein hydrolase activator NlpD
MNVRGNRYRIVVLSLAILLVGTISDHTPKLALAQDSGAIQSQIDSHNQQIADLEKEIAQYQQQLNVLGTQRQTLQSAIKSIDVTRQQTGTEIRVTQNKMDASELRLQQLSGQISQKEYEMQLDRKSVADSLKNLAITDGDTMIERIFASGSLADAWTAADSKLAVTDALRANAAELAGVTAELGAQKADEGSTKEKLEKLNAELAAQKRSLDVNKAEKDKLLTQTKSQETSYQSLIAQKKAQQKVFENELGSLQTQLKAISQTSIPVIQTGVLAWPYSPTFAAGCESKSGALGNSHCVTQYFGNTAFAASGAYNGAGHNGIDIGMPVGTPVQSSLSGTVLATGNTDTAHDAAGNQCYSFGKWVVVKHANGLATLYAHLSQISVSGGQAVSTGQVIGYSGMTGYATGPHLHYAVYASAGVQIMTLSQFRGSTTACGNATMPVAPLNAYLNPMSYL